MQTSGALFAVFLQIEDTYVVWVLDKTNACQCRTDMVIPQSRRFDAAIKGFVQFHHDRSVWHNELLVCDVKWCDDGRDEWIESHADLYAGEIGVKVCTRDVYDDDTTFFPSGSSCNHENRLGSDGRR